MGVDVGTLEKAATAEEETPLSQATTKLQATKKSMATHAAPAACAISKHLMCLPPPLHRNIGSRSRSSRPYVVTLVPRVAGSAAAALEKGKTAEEEAWGMVCSVEKHLTKSPNELQLCRPIDQAMKELLTTRSLGEESVLFADRGHSGDDDAATPKKRKTAAWEELVGSAMEAPIFTEPKMADMVRSWGDVDGAVLHPSIHELEDINSDSPVNLVQGLQPSRRATRSLGGATTWLFRIRVPANCGRRSRMVVGEEEGTWHEEAGPKPILGTDGSVVAYKRTFSYMVNNSGCPQRAGWTMIEISLDMHPADQWILCLVYESNRKSPKAPRSKKQPRLLLHDEEEGDELPCTGTGDSYMPSPSPAPTTAMRRLSLRKMKEDFILANRLFHRTIDGLGPDSFDKLVIRLQHIADTERLSPRARRHLVNLATRMFGTSLSKCLSVSKKRARQDSNDALERTGVNAQQVSQRASKDQVMDLPLAVQDIGSEADAEHCAAIPGPDEDVEAVELNEWYRNMGDIMEIASDDGDRFPVGAPQGDRYTMPVGVPEGGEPAVFDCILPLDAAGFASLVGVDQGYSAGFPDIPLDRPLFDNSAGDSMIGLVADEVDGFDDGGTYVDFLNLDQDDHTEAEAEQQGPEAEVLTGLVAGEVDQSRPMDEFNHGGLFGLGFLNQLQDEHNDGAIDQYFFNLPQDDHTEAEARSRLAGIW